MKRTENEYRFINFKRNENLVDNDKCFNIFVCPICQKEFYVKSPICEWAYKDGAKRKKLLFCSWKCLNNYRKGEIKNDFY